MADLIDRNIVLDTVFDVMSDNKINHKHRALNRNIKQIPTVSTQRHAHWILEKKYKDNENDYACSNCSFDWAIPENCLSFFKFCPHCGAKMDEEE